MLLPSPTLPSLFKIIFRPRASPPTHQHEQITSRRQRRHFQCHCQYACIRRLPLRVSRNLHALHTLSLSQALTLASSCRRLARLTMCGASTPKLYRRKTTRPPMIHFLNAEKFAAGATCAAADTLASLPSIYNFVLFADFELSSSFLVDADDEAAAAAVAAATPPGRVSNALTFVAHTPNLHTSLPA
eukprot:4189701-Pleurochrysis_carterae.AAC.1